MPKKKFQCSSCLTKCISIIHIQDIEAPLPAAPTACIFKNTSVTSPRWELLQKHLISYEGVNYKMKKLKDNRDCDVPEKHWQCCQTTCPKGGCDTFVLKKVD